MGGHVKFQVDIINGYEVEIDIGGMFGYHVKTRALDFLKLARGRRIHYLDQYISDVRQTRNQLYRNNMGQLHVLSPILQNASNLLHIGDTETHHIYASNNPSAYKIHMPTYIRFIWLQQAKSYLFLFKKK